jgi:hypothetical protein
VYAQWGSGDLNPDALRHKILSLARLPIPTLPRERGLRTDIKTAHIKKVNPKLTKVNQNLTRQLIDAFLASRRQGLSTKTITFYHTCLSKAIGMELTSLRDKTIISLLAVHKLPSKWSGTLKYVLKRYYLL